MSVKMAVLAPIPKASETIATAPKPGLFASMRRLNRKSSYRPSNIASRAAERTCSFTPRKKACKSCGLVSGLPGCRQRLRSGGPSTILSLGLLRWGRREGTARISVSSGTGQTKPALRGSFCSVPPEQKRHARFRPKCGLFVARQSRACGTSNPARTESE